MEHIKNNWGWYLLILAVIIYFAFMKQINNWVKNLLKVQVQGLPGSYSESMTCDTTFYVKLSDGKYQNVWTTDEGFEGGAPNVKYYKQDVTFTQDGVNNIGEFITITKEEFKGLCDFKYNPPYAWYTAEASTGTPRPIRNSR